MESRKTQREIFSIQRQESREIKIGSEHTQSQRIKRLLRKMKKGATIALIVACLETGGSILYHHFYYASYQPAQCVVQYEQVQYQPSDSHNSSAYYEPEVIYQVISPSDANPNTYPGYAGPGSFQDRMDTPAKAQSLLDPFQVGQTYPCWYSSFGIQPEAVLILQPFERWEIVLTAFATLTIGFLLSMISVRLTFLLAQLRHLRKKGVITTGIVREEWIEFEVSSDPVKKIRAPYNANSQRREPGSEVNILYDPQDPQYNFRIAESLYITRSLNWEEFAGWCFFVLFWLPLTIFALALLYAA